MSALAQSWCPTCRELSVLNPGQRCAWCDTTLVRKRGGCGSKRPGVVGRIDERKARAIHAKYQTGVSANRLGKELYAVLGYPNPRACASAIGAAFKRWNLPVRDRIEATVLASTTSGLSPRDFRERYRRRKAAGLTIHMEPLQPKCAAVRENYPRKGQPCQRPAKRGSDFCHVHDPARRAEIASHLERIRSRSPKRPGTHRSEKRPSDSP